MGLLGKKGGFDETAAILSLFSPQAGFNYRKGKVKRREDAAEQAALERVRAGLKARNYSDADIDVLLADPKAASSLIADELRLRQGGAEGMTIRSIDPATGQPRTETTAGWHDGNYFGGSDGATAPRALTDIPKIVPIQAGGNFRAFGGATGRMIPEAELRGGASGAPGIPSGPPAGAPRIGGPPAPASGESPPGTTYTDPDDGRVYRKLNSGDDGEPGNWAPIAQGGAGPRGPSRFPY